jgi:hypothetical protein
MRALYEYLCIEIYLYIFLRIHNYLYYHTYYHHINYRSNIINSLLIRIVNDYSILHLYDEIRNVLVESLEKLPEHCSVVSRVAHVLIVSAFSQGDIVEVYKHKRYLNSSDLLTQRSSAAHVFINDDESRGIQLMETYAQSLGSRLHRTLGFKDGNHNYSSIKNYDNNDNNNYHKNKESSDNDNDDHNDNNRNNNFNIIKSISDEKSEELLLELLLYESSGYFRVSTKLSDLVLTVTDIRPLDAKLRFRLGVGLAKLGLFEW